jgi:nitroimidazol reductase NimA-like FMN-containing flavoprotein (pyridoxamine 5'-phosphate oxidase superfamily)
MKSELRDLALRILGEHRIMTVATNRSDGWPQATVVAYANNGLLLYFFVARLSQKFANLKRDSRVSAAIGGDFTDPDAITGLSLAGNAEIVTEDGEYERAAGIFLDRFPEYTDWPKPNPAIAPLMKITPTLLSVIDYSKGFGHSDLVEVEKGDLRQPIPQPRSDWLGRSA